MKIEEIAAVIEDALESRRKMIQGRLKNVGDAVVLPPLQDVMEALVIVADRMPDTTLYNREIFFRGVLATCAGLRCTDRFNCADAPTLHQLYMLATWAQSFTTFEEKVKELYGGK